MAGCVGPRLWTGASFRAADGGFNGRTTDDQVRLYLDRGALSRHARLGDALRQRAHPEAGAGVSRSLVLPSHAPTDHADARNPAQVKILHDDARVRLANQVNLASAMRTALLLLPESFTERLLYETIAGLSYRGDFRMAVGENPAKVRNIVAAQLDDFRRLYGGLLKSFWKSVFVIGEQPGERGAKGERLMRQDMSTARRAALACKLPVGLRGKVQAHYERKWNLSDALKAAKEGAAVQADQASEVEALELWERIVDDAEFTQIVSKSACFPAHSGPPPPSSVPSVLR